MFSAWLSGLDKLRPSSGRCILGHSHRDFEAKSVDDVNLSIYKRGDMLCISSVLHTSY